MGALILSRRKGETIVIDGDIKVTVVGIEYGQVKIAVDAPRSVTVDREEIHERKIKGVPQ